MMRARIGLRVGVPTTVVVLGLLLSPATSATPHADTWRVTVENLTAGQPLTPPVAAVHRGQNLVFKVGRPASFELKEIAENGNNGPLLDRLADSHRVAQALEGPGGPLVPPGKPGSATFDERTEFVLHGGHGATRLSIASMLICTNDGFTGVNGLSLPETVGDSAIRFTAGYDAGTELNTEDFADIVPPCQGLIGVSSGEPGTGTSNPALAEGGVIRHHAGIFGGADLVPAIHGWDTEQPVAKVTVDAIG